MWAQQGAATYQLAGNTGAGVKIAIIDLGFDGLSAAQASGDLPSALTTGDFCGGDFNYTDHGTAVAEIVHEMAPDAQLYLLCIGTEVDLAQAEAYAEANGIDIINHSVGWYNTSRGDGTGEAGTPDAIAAAATAAGILWVNAAGNNADSHWSGNFAGNVNDSHVFNPGNGDWGNDIWLDYGEGTCASLKWDDWPATNQDFDLFLWSSTLDEVVWGSDNWQTGTEPPTEDICYANYDYPAGERYFLEIVAFDVSTTPRMDLFVDVPLQYQVAAGSVVEPASAPAVMAVGAACSSGTTIEFFSSLGRRSTGGPSPTSPDLTRYPGTPTVPTRTAPPGTASPAHRPRRRTWPARRPCSNTPTHRPRRPS